MMRIAFSLVSLVSILFAVAPIGARASTSYVVLDQPFNIRGTEIAGGKSFSFAVSSTNPLNFTFASPSYVGTVNPPGDFLAEKGFVLSFVTPASFQYKRSDFNFYDLPPGTTTFQGTGDGAPMILDLPFADPLGTPVTVSTSDGDQSYYPVVELQATVTSLNITSIFKLPVPLNGTAGDGARYNGTISFIDPVDGSVGTGTITGLFGLEDLNGVMQLGDSNSLILRDAGYIVSAKSSENGSLPIPEPSQYLLISLGLLAVGATLRRRGGLPASVR
jgi:hypothetical protein